MFVRTVRRRSQAGKFPCDDPVDSGTVDETVDIGPVDSGPVEGPVGSGMADEGASNKGKLDSGPVELPGPSVTL